jgi:hypothetical protein
MNLNLPDWIICAVMKNELQGMPQRNEDFLLKTSLRNIEAISK